MTYIKKILPIVFLLVYTMQVYPLPINEIDKKNNENQTQVDSLLALITDDISDSLKAVLFNKVANLCSNLDERLNYVKRSLEYNKHKNPELLLDNYAIIANCYYVTHKLESFMQYVHRGIDMAKVRNNNYYLQRFYKMLSIYYDQNNNPDSMFYYINAALEINILSHDTVNMAVCYQEFGLKYANRYSFREAEDCYRKAMQLDSLKNRIIDYAVDCYRLGELYTIKGDDSVNYFIAKSYLIPAVKVFDSQHFDDYRYSIYKYLAYNSLANVYIVLADKLNDHSLADSCYYYNKQSRDFFTKSGYDDYYSCYVSFTYLNYLNYYKKYQEALKVLLTLKEHIDDRNIDLLDYYYMSLHPVYEALGDYKHAYAALKKYYEYNSKLKNDSTQSVIADSKTEQAVMIERIKREKDKEVYLAEQQRSKVLVVSLVVGLFLVSVFVFFILRALRFRKRANLELSEKNEMLSQQKNEIAAQRDEIVMQRDEIAMQRDQIEMVNTELVRSISYAERIQRATVSSIDQIHDIFPDSFIIHHPRDIVSGDFFRAERCGQYSVMILADCTGHGIPGAFLSMLGISALKEYMVKEEDAENPGTVLDRMRDFVKSTLANTYDGSDISDGMDMTICCFDADKQQLRYAIANQKAVLVRQGEAIKLVGDKMPVGRSLMERKPFQSLSILIEQGDMLYMFSDGIQDQFGGERQKKFKLVTLVDTLVSVSEHTLEAQSQFLEQVIKAWRGDNEQVDDITLVGIRV